MELKQWLNTATPLARTLVRSILRTHAPEPLHTHRIFALAHALALDSDPELQEQAHTHALMHARLVRRSGVPQPPAPEHPIRSVRYLKHVVLPDLAERDEIVKVPHKRTPTDMERMIAEGARPPTNRERNLRGAVGPGRRPVKFTKGEVVEYAWRLKEPHEKTWVEERREIEREKEEKREKKAARKAAERAEKHRRTPLRRTPGWENEMQWAERRRDYWLPGLAKPK